ncbi:putative protein of unknown function (DUF3533) [Lyophyllum shimeji]|uniref:DUF3533 domain-containing protein n=1 Tax=Lyophyllum shimeji TaxID=47721 RepID=A0A9P3UMR7_LYOSH|nr:putative protein of unknown function (DUF3533) [Lyophyllum shimeji]
MESPGSERRSSAAGSVPSTAEDDRLTSPATNKEPFSSQFLDGSGLATKARQLYMKILLQRTCLIIVAMFAIFSIYWAALSHVPARSLEGWIVDFDEGRIGQTVVGQLDKFSSPALSWKVHEASDFPNGAADLIEAVVEERCWVAVAINRGSTAKLNLALAGGVTASYDGSSAITAYGIEARNENAFRTLLRPTLDNWLNQVSHDFAIDLFKDMASNSSIRLASITPEALVRPVYFTIQNLRPFDVPVATAVTFVGLIYLLILSFFVVNSGIMARAASGLERQLTLGSLIRVRMVTPVLIYLILSCFYSLVSMMFELPFDRKCVLCWIEVHNRFGRSGFLVFWMISWFGMMAAGLALESMVTLLTIKYIQIFLILWIISNVSVCLWPIDALPKVYTYGHAAPFYQISRAVRTIVFRTKNEVGLNFGILLVWILISCITLPVIQWYRRREEVRDWLKQRENEKGSRDFHKTEGASEADSGLLRAQAQALHAALGSISTCYIPVGLMRASSNPVLEIASCDPIPHESPICL